MDQLQAILDNYQKLCGYCDLIWKRVRGACPNEIACRKGCGICCELQSVNRLEAHIIRSHIKKTNGRRNREGHNGIYPPAPPSAACPFLHDDDQSCLIYPARPIICRTHGLVIHSAEFAQAATCPYNFPSIHPKDLPPELTIDTDRVTRNLTNLNMAFCMIMGIDTKGVNEGLCRVMLKDLALNPA